MSNPGVLLLIADDWSPLARCYGNEVVQTPAIDTLAQRATVFDQAFCTSPSCAASRASLLTGQYGHQHGQYGHSHGIHGFRTHEQLADCTLPAVLRKGGVFTGLIGKDHIAPKSVYPFDVDDRSDPMSNRKLASTSRAFFEEARGRPFFLQVASLYPHRTGGTFDTSRGDPELAAADVRYSPRDVVVPDWLPDVEAVRVDLAAYYTFVSRFDRFVGAMLDELERSGRAQDTLVIVMSDHGMPFPGAKATMYDSGHHCPLLIAHPAGSGAERSQALVNWCDLFPTVCEFLGVASPLQLPGRSVLPLLQRNTPGWDHTFFSHICHEVTNYYPYRVLRERQRKLVHHLAHQLPLPLATDLFDSPTWQTVRSQKLSHMGARETSRVLQHDEFELYDVERDPAETTNLATDPQCAIDFARMRKTLLQFRQRTNDPWLELDHQQGRVSARTWPG